MKKQTKTLFIGILASLALTACSFHRSPPPPCDKANGATFSSSYDCGKSRPINKF